MAVPEVPVVPHRIVHVVAYTSPTGAQQFDSKRIEVYVSQQVQVILHNKEPAASGISHNWVLIKPGTEPAVAALGKQAGVDPDGVTYSPAILAATRTVRPGQIGTVDFAAPDIPGEYPFMSLVGNQYQVMRGVMVVRPIH